MDAFQATASKTLSLYVFFRQFAYIAFLGFKFKTFRMQIMFNNILKPATCNIFFSFKYFSIGNN